MILYYCDEVHVLPGWMKQFLGKCPEELIVDEVIHMHQGNDPEILVLDEDFHALGHTMKKGFHWNGASTPNLPLLRWIAAKFHKNIKASCLHDELCGRAKNWRDRLVADVKYLIMLLYIEKAPKWKCKAGFLGVRVGARLGIGSSF